jgi:uncharacterized protein YwgA
MNRDQARAVMVTFIERLRENKSWCGETHIQKAAYLLKHLAGVPLPFDFILYKHGPFSFDLSDELTAMRAYQLLDIHAQYPYGHRMTVTEVGNAFRRRFSKTLEAYERQIGFVSRTLGEKGVAELERLATAFFVTLQGADGEPFNRAERLHEIKPHILPDVAEAAVESVVAIIGQARGEGLATI